VELPVFGRLFRIFRYNTQKGHSTPIAGFGNFPTAPVETGRLEGEDMELNLDGLSLDAEQLDISRKIAVIHLLRFQNRFRHPGYTGNRPEPAQTVA
jgi:hypothetical protein